jgi:hypothetical protein
MSHSERGANVGAEIQLLERHRGTLVCREDLLDALVNYSEALLIRELRRRLDDTPVESQQTPAAALDHAEAGVGQAGIYAEDDHLS